MVALTGGMKVEKKTSAVGADQKTERHCRRKKFKIRQARRKNRRERQGKGSVPEQQDSVGWTILKRPKHVGENASSLADRIMQARPKAGEPPVQ